MTSLKVTCLNDSSRWVVLENGVTFYSDQLQTREIWFLVMPISGKKQRSTRQFGLEMLRGVFKKYVPDMLQTWNFAWSKVKQKQNFWVLDFFILGLYFVARQHFFKRRGSKSGFSGIKNQEIGIEKFPKLKIVIFS